MHAAPLQRCMHYFARFVYSSCVTPLLFPHEIWPQIVPETIDLQRAPISFRFVRLPFDCRQTGFVPRIFVPYSRRSVPESPWSRSGGTVPALPHDSPYPQNLELPVRDFGFAYLSVCLAWTTPSLACCCRVHYWSNVPIQSVAYVPTFQRQFKA